MALNSYLGGFIVVFGGGLLAVIGLLVTRKALDIDKITQSHEVSGYLLSVVGTLYAVLLGLVVVDAMQIFQQARDVTEREANSLADIFILAKGLPEPKRSEIQKMCADYNRQVITTEWDLLHHGEVCPEAQRIAIELMQSLIDFEPTTENTKAIYPQMIADSSQLWQSRRSRINRALNGIPTVEWVSLMAGGVITIFFMYFFCLRHLRLQIIMTAMVAMLISLNMFLLLLFGYPFSGDLGISPEAYHINQMIFEHGANAPIVKTPPQH